MSDSTASYFNSDTLRLPTKLTTNIANISTPDLALDIGDIVVHHDNVEPINSEAGLNIPLDGDWVIEGKSWTLDNNGLRLDSGVVNTQLLDVNFTALQILPDQITFGDFDTEQMAISGVATLTVTGNAAFGYDNGANCWSLSIGPPTGEDICGYMPGFHPMAPTDKIFFNNFFVQSNGSKGFTMPGSNPVTLGKVGVYTIQQFIPKSDFVQVSGLLDLGIPNLPSFNSIGQIRKEEGVPIFQQNNINKTISVNGVEIKFTTSGGTPQWYDNTGFHSKVVVGEEGAFALPSLLDRMIPRTVINVDTGSVVPMGTVSMTDVEGAMDVQSNAWTNFWYEGDLQNDNQEGRLRFEVIGDIVASDQSIGVDNIETPFGTLALVYNFQEQQIEGTLHVEQDLSGTIIVGDATLLISGTGKGWYFFAGLNFKLPNPTLEGTAGFAVGNFQLTQKQLDQFAEYSYKNKGLPPQFHNFNGFFFEGTVMIPIPICPNFDFDFGIVSAHLTCQVGGNARFGMNFGPVNTYFIAVRGIGVLEAGVGASVVIACAGLTAGIEIGPNIEGMYQSNGEWYVLGDFPITLYGEAYVGWGICDSKCEGALCDKESASASITLGLMAYIGSDDEYFKFYFK